MSKSLPRTIATSAWLTRALDMRLTPRQEQAVQLLAAGFTAKQAAHEMRLTCVSYRKLLVRARRRADLTTWQLIVRAVLRCPGPVRL